MTDLELSIYFLVLVIVEIQTLHGETRVIDVMLLDLVVVVVAAVVVVMKGVSYFF